MEFLKCRDVRWKGPGKRNKPDLHVVATTAKHPDSRSQISRYGWMQPTYMRSVSFLGKFTSGSRISASRSDLLKHPIFVTYCWDKLDKIWLPAAGRGTNFIEYSNQLKYTSLIWIC